jgi:ParB family chromosome partitioning protein
MANFKNRILEYGVKPADQFLAHPKNARMHPQFQREAMKAALDTVGFVAPVLEAASGYLVDGHERIWQALQNNNADVPFVRLDISEEEEAYVLATFDPLTALANYDAELLDGLLQEVNSDSPAIQQMLSDLAIDVGLTPPDFAPVDMSEQPRLDQKSPITCPSCGHEFIPKS